MTNNHLVQSDLINKKIDLYQASAIVAAFFLLVVGHMGKLPSHKVVVGWYKCPRQFSEGLDSIAASLFVFNWLS